MAASVRVQGRIGLEGRTVVAILDREAQMATREATALLKQAVDHETPVGRGPDLREGHPGLLRDSHRQSVRKTPFGWSGTLRRDTAAWYGRIVEKGRKAGTGRGGRRVGAMAANPFIDRAAAQVDQQAADILEGGAGRAAAQIQARLG